MFCENIPTHATRLPSAPRANKVVYGADDRVDEAGASGFWQGIGSKTVMLVPRSKLTLNDDCTWRLNHTRTHGFAPGGKLQGVGCPDVPFADQLNPGFCSGTFIDCNMVATAG
jgi:hypothetical protein